MRFISHFLLPVVCIVVAAIVSLCAALFWLTSVQDDMEAARERQAVEFSLKQEIEFVSTLNNDYAFWDEAARRGLLSLDGTWLHENIGAYLFDDYGFQFSFVVEPDGRAPYAMIDGVHRQSANPAQMLGAGYAAAMRALLQAPRGETISGLTKTSRGLAIFSISDIRPNTQAVAVPKGTRRVLVMSRLVDSNIVAKLGRTAQGLRLRLVPPEAAAAGALPISTYDGQQAATLRWTTGTPGTLTKRQMLPWLALLAIGLVVLGTFVVLKARRAVRELTSSEARARHIAHHDALTGLPNRRAFTDHLLALSRGQSDYAILYMDLDGFKEVNDAFGHGTGDALLRRTSERLYRVTPRGSFLARLGGDEFAIACGSCDKADLEALAERVIAAVREPHDLGGEPIVVGTSLGIATRDGEEYEMVVRRADVAMYAAKARGRDGWCVYDPSLDDGRRDRKLLEGELRRAIEAGDISVVFQPIVQASDGKITAVEALARWIHPVKGPISPDIFIPIAEETGAIVELGRYVLRKACEAAIDWPFRLAVNLSPAQFWDRTLVESVLTTLDECGFPAEKLEFEITETYLLRRPEAATEIIAELRKHGIKVALDDFGTGYASIGYLRRFELDLVKLDRSFVEHVATSTEAADIAHAVIALGGALKLPILAEGVETEAQAMILSAAGCSYMQGWHFGHPVPAHEIDARLRTMTQRAIA